VRIKAAVIPWLLLSYNGNSFVLVVSSDQLSQLPSVFPNDPRLLQSGDWQDQVDQFFADDLPQIRAARPHPGGTGRETVRSQCSSTSRTQHDARSNSRT
jgi:hypothetical protein